uniref:Actin interacting protein 3-like C-terminal domain-containing protein n=2 Tax=Clastoptera arizonana TaxID=38151 RepID=A0A1B6E1T9_9HEMI
MHLSTSHHDGKRGHDNPSSPKGSTPSDVTQPYQERDSSRVRIKQRDSAPEVECVYVSECESETSAQTLDRITRVVNDTQRSVEELSHGTKERTGFLPRGALSNLRKKLAFWNSEPSIDKTYTSVREEGAGLNIEKLNKTEPSRVTPGRSLHFKPEVNGIRDNKAISASSPDLKRFDDNNNKYYKNSGKRDGYADFIKKLSVDKVIYSDDDIDYSADLGRAVASQLLSSDSEESIDEELVDRFRREFSKIQFGGSRESLDKNVSVESVKTAPIIETPPEKKKVGGIRRLLSPGGIFSNDAQRKKNVDVRPTTPVTPTEGKVKTLVETAFIGGEKKATRSKSVSPTRGSMRDEMKGRYGVPKTNNGQVRNDQYYYYGQRGQDQNRNVPNQQLGLLQVDTGSRRDSVASSTSSTSTLVSPEETTPPWARNLNKNEMFAKTQSMPGYAKSVQKSQIPVNQSGRLSAPPYIDYYNNQHRFGQDRLLIPVGAQMKISSPTQSPQKQPNVSRQLRGLLSPQNVRGRAPDYLYYQGHSSSVESSPGSQNSPQNFDKGIVLNAPLVKPQPMYNYNNQKRPRSVSPSSGRPALPPDSFVRGSNQRSTFSGGRPPRQSTIYEEVHEENTENGNKEKGKYGTIYKHNNASSDGDLNSGSGKRVSFSPNHENDVNTGIYWPTRKGLAPEPPTRRSVNETPQSPNYVNVNELKNQISQAPDRPLPPIPRRIPEKQIRQNVGVIAPQQLRAVNSPGRVVNQPTTERVQALANRWQQCEQQKVPVGSNRWHQQSDTESGSEAGEVQRIMQQNNNGTYFRFSEEEWAAEGKSGRGGSEQSGNASREEETRRGRGRRDDPRRHTLSGEHHHNYPTALARSMDLESPLPRGYPPPSTAMLFDEDPGIMSEVETSSTGFRRGGKQRSSLPVVRTPSKTLERPLGLVFLQYRSETKRALLPNEITSIDTVKALFVRSFPKQLTMEYLDSPMVKIYIHDSSKDMFYELEDLRSHLRDIRDRSVLRLFESADVGGGGLPTGMVAPPTWDQDQSYFSEPEFDSEYQHQHIHKTKGSKSSHQPYYMTHSFPPGGAPATLPRSGAILRAYSPAVPGAKTPTDRMHTDAGYMSSPERGAGAPPPRPYPAPYTGPGTAPYDDPYYSQYGSRTGSITPVIDEEASDTELIDESYSLYGVKLPVPRGQFPAPAYDATRLRVENMERQLANLTGLVQKALTQAPTPTPREFLQVPPGSTTNYRNASDDYDKHSSSSSASLPDESYLRTDVKPPKLGKDKSVSFEKSVSFSDEPPDMNSPKQHSPQHGERDRHKPTPPPKPASLTPTQYDGRHVYRDLQLTPEMYNQLRGLQKRAKDLRQEVRNLRRMSQAQAHTVRETIRDNFIKIRAMIMTGGEGLWSENGDSERIRLNHEEELYKQEMIRLETDLTELESTVEELRGNVINRKTRVNMSDVENMALILSKSSKTVADLKLRFPSLQEAMRSCLSQEMEKVVCEEKFLKEEPERLESALRRCKKLTGTLVTLKRLASVQEQRLPDARISPTMDETPPVTPTSGKFVKVGCTDGAK